MNKLVARQQGIFDGLTFKTDEEWEVYSLWEKQVMSTYNRAPTQEESLKYRVGFKTGALSRYS